MEGIFCNSILNKQVEDLIAVINAAEGLGTGVRIRLVKSSQAAIVRGTVWDGVISAHEADFSGYASEVIDSDDFSASADDGTGFWTGLAERTWAFDSGAGSTANTIRHIVVTGCIAGGPDLIFFSWTLEGDKTMAADGDTFSATLKIRCQNPPWPV